MLQSIMLKFQVDKYFSEGGSAPPERDIKIMSKSDNDFYRELAEASGLAELEKVASAAISSIDANDMEKISSVMGSLNDTELQKLADELDSELRKEHSFDPLADEDEEDEDFEDEDQEDEYVDEEESNDEEYDDEEDEDDDYNMGSEASEDNELEMLKLAYDEAYVDLMEHGRSLNDYIKSAYSVDMEALAGDQVISHITKIASDNDLNPLIVVDDVMNLWIKKNSRR